MAQYGYQGGYVPSSGYSQPAQYQTMGGVGSSPEYSPAGLYSTGGTHQNPLQNQGPSYPSGVPGAVDYNSSHMQIDSNSPAPSSGTGTISNATSGYQSNTTGFSGMTQIQNQPGFPSGPGSKGHSISPSPANAKQNVSDDDLPEFRWWIPSEGISRPVISREIQHYLGADALVKPGTGRGKDEVS
jgi:hypothetical protein